MQISRLTGLRRIALDPIEKRSTARQTTGDDVAGERLGFHDHDIRFAGNGDEIIGSIAA